MTDPFLKVKPENNKQTGVNQPVQNQGQKTSNPNNPQTKKVKKGFKLGIKGFVIGCLILFFLILILTSIALYMILGNPTLLKNYGLSASTIKSLLMTFAILFFGIIFFVGFGLLVMNSYRFFTQPLNRFKYGIVAFFGFLLFAGSLGFGTISIIKIRNMSGESTFISNNIVDPYVILKENKIDKPIYIGEVGKVIAPVYMAFRMNKELFNQKITPEIGTNDNLLGLELDCGNGQSVKADRSILGERPFFDGKCLFVEKKRYELTLKYHYYGKGNLGEQNGMIKVTDLDIDSVINVIPPNGKYGLNDSKSEILVGIAPSLVQFDAQKVFTDLELADTKIDWDLDGDGNTDDKDKALPRYNYETPNKYDIIYRLPNYSEYQYFFTIRVQESDIPPCKVTYTPKGGFNYSFSVDIDKKIKTKKIEYEIVNEETNKPEKRDLSPGTKFTEKIPAGGIYSIKVTYTTNDNKQGTCESEKPIDTKVGNYIITPEFSLKLPSDQEYIETAMTGNAIEIPVIPSSVRFKIAKIEPEEIGIKKTVDLEGDTLTPIDGDDTFEFDISEKKDKNLIVTLENEKGRKSEHKYIIRINEKPIIARIKANPVVGEDPLDVELDASISMINNDDDEIVYFTWDFGDGENMENVSQGKLTHTYKFNKENKDGKYYPQVTVQSKNGYESTYKLRTPILVKRQVRKIEINIDSHPTQIANYGEIVRMSVNTDGDIKKITWDFGNNKTVTCEGRECISTSTSYDQPGTYNIKVSVEYNDFPTATNNIKIKIK